MGDRGGVGVMTSQLDLGILKPEVKPLASVDYSSESNEYYTPRHVIELAREVLGEIDLDPASSPLANSVVKADKIFTISDNGLSLPWQGSFLCNPPGGRLKNRSVAALWWDKAVLEWESERADCGVFIAFNAELISRRQNVWDFQVCIPKKRLSFIKPGLTGTLEVDNSPPKFNAIIHLPSRKRDTASLFHAYFSSIGRVIQDKAIAEVSS